MAQHYSCDGCETVTPLADLTAIGQLDPAHYCAACLVVYQAFQTQLEAARLAAVTAYETRRAAVLAQAATVLQRWPDA